MDKVRASWKALFGLGRPRNALGGVLTWRWRPELFIIHNHWIPVEGRHILKTDTILSLKARKREGLGFEAFQALKSRLYALSII